MAEHFAAALDLLETLHQSIESDRDTTNVLATLDSVLTRVACLESSAAEPRNRLSKSGKSMGRELIEEVTRFEAIVRETRDRVQLAATAFLAKMDGLVPVLERTQRGQRMHLAYGDSLGRNAR
jgi:hypothetical protein